MPKVGKDKFPYTSAGVQKAQKHAKATGQKVDMSGYQAGGIHRDKPPKAKSPRHSQVNKKSVSGATRGGKTARNWPDMMDKYVGKGREPSGGRGSKLRWTSGYKHPKGIGTTSKAPLHEKRYAHSVGTRPGQKSSVQKAGTRSMQRAGVRPDTYVGKPTPQSGGRGRAGSGLKHALGAGTTGKGASKGISTGLSKRLGINKKKGGAVKKKYHHGGRVMGGQKKPKKC
jgi:hypothetical protein